MIQPNFKIDRLTMDQWQTYAQSHPDSSIFHHRRWIELLHQQYGFEIELRCLRENGEIRAAIPFLKTRSLRGTRKLISLPFTDYLHVLSESASATEQLCHLLRDELEGQFDTVMIRGVQPIDGLAFASHHVRHELSTEAPLEVLEQKFESSIRRNLRKALKQELVFEQRNDRNAIETFYRLHVLTRRKLGVPVQPTKYFQRLYEKLIEPGLGVVGVVSRHGTPLAAVVLLGFNRRLVYKYAASDPAALQYRPNDWLVFNAIRIASEQDYDCFDFGITDKQQDGLRRFKSKWGAAESDIFYSYLLGHPDATGGPSRAVRLAGEVIKRSPTAVCRVLGQTFYKYSQ